MVNVKIAKKIKEQDPKAFEKIRENLVVGKIRTRYSLNEELAILRQRDDKPLKFAEYNSYVEECKAAVDAELEV